jgi:hypothetical protein
MKGWRRFHVDKIQRVINEDGPSWFMLRHGLVTMGPRYDTTKYISVCVFGCVLSDGTGQLICRCSQEVGQHNLALEMNSVKHFNLTSIYIFTYLNS